MKYLILFDDCYEHHHILQTSEAISPSPLNHRAENDINHLISCLPLVKNHKALVPLVIDTHILALLT